LRPASDSAGIKSDDGDDDDNEEESKHEGRGGASSRARGRVDGTS